MKTEKQETIDRKLFGLFLQLRDYFYLEEKGTSKDDLDIRKIMLKKSVKSLEKDMSKDNPDNIIKMPNRNK